MKAVVYTEYGTPDVLKVKEIEKPTPKDNEILIRVHATSVNIGDLWARNFKAISPSKFSMPFPFWLPARLYFGVSKPNVRVLGSEFSGKVESVGKNVKSFKAGDSVFGYRGQSLGANAEYLCVSENSLVTHKPANISYEEAATIPYGALTALSLLRTVKIQKRQKVLINGASGGIGSAALQLAKYYGAEVTAVCSTPRLGFVKSLGADKVIDYTKEDFTKNGETYDLIFDIMNKSSFEKCKDSLTPKGVYLLASFKMKQVFQMMRTAKSNSKKVICAMSSEKLEDLIFIKELVEAGKIKAIVDKRYPMERTAEAHQYIESGNKKGSVIVTMV
ncbi:MAG: NAD(P)-dependent alcohol dehydrogenase [Anaerolineales bacterium]|nr:NAD(P)-dependent alcohol dehydrogenase [Anaerolineales bacterium]MBX3038010.1 NAD(P)-dependent alcohol dehydrogenase [Anaerolineales bacterium]